MLDPGLLQSAVGTSTTCHDGPVRSRGPQYNVGGVLTTLTPPLLLLRF